MKTIILIFLVIINISCNHKTVSEKVDQNHIVSDKEVYSFLNVVLKKQSKSLTTCRNEHVLEFIKDNEELESMFNAEDLVFVNKQIENEKKFALNSDYLSSSNVIPEKIINKLFIDSKNIDTFWLEFEKKYETQSYFSVSLPIFSSNKKTVIISTEILNRGGFGASGKTVYRKINGEWKLYKNYNSSIS